MNRLVFHIFIVLLTFPNGYVIIKKTVRKRLRYMLEVKFYEKAEDSLLKFAVILSKADGKWVFCKHKDRQTWEVPGGHREAGETIYDAAIRELIEETGAVDFTITPVCVYSVTENRPDGFCVESFGMLFYADIFSFEEIHSEIEKIILCDDPVDNWTYPLIQPKLMEEAGRRGFL